MDEGLFACQFPEGNLALLGAQHKILVCTGVQHTVDRVLLLANFVILVPNTGHFFGFWVELEETNVTMGPHGKQVKTYRQIFDPLDPAAISFTLRSGGLQFHNRQVVDFAGVA